MTAVRDAALDYAARGWPVFPLHGIVNGVCTCGRQDCSSPGKHPLVKRGLYEATTDFADIGEWWRRWRRANVGVATGTGSGIVVVDVDLPLAFASLDALVHKLPRTRVALTGGGGLHLLYRGDRDRPPLHNHASRLPGLGDLPGVDLRAERGYVVAPPSIHRSGGRYEWLDEQSEIAPAPEWLKEPERTHVDLGDVKPVDFSGEGTAYGRAALDSALTSLRAAPLGQRNHTLNRVTFCLAQLVAGGELLEGAVRSSVLDAALAIGLDEPESRQTIDSAFDAGLRLPRVAPHRMIGNRSGQGGGE